MLNMDNNRKMLTIAVNISVVRPKAIKGEREKFGRPRNFFRTCMCFSFWKLEVEGHLGGSKVEAKMWKASKFRP